MFEYSKGKRFAFDSRPRNYTGAPSLARFAADNLDEEKILEVINWCREHFGPARENAWWYETSVVVMGLSVSFCDEREAFEFRMRWC